MAATYEISAAPTYVTFLQAGETETFAFDAGTGANRLLNVFVGWRDRGQDCTVTYNSVSMVSAAAKVSGPTSLAAGHLFRLAGPASGSNNIAVTMGSNGVGDCFGVIAAWVANSVDQTTPVDGFASNSGTGGTSGATGSLSITSPVDDRAVVFYYHMNDAEEVTGTPTNYTERQDASSGGVALEYGDAAGTGGAIATSIVWSNGVSNWEWVALGVNVNASGAGGNDLSANLGEPVVGGSVF